VRLAAPNTCLSKCHSTLTPSELVSGHCVTSRIMNEFAVVTYRLVKEHQACGLKGLVFALDTGGHIDVM